MDGPTSNAEKAHMIRRWMDPDERITVDFTDEWNLNAEVRDCTNEVVDLALETRFPHMKQEIVLPLRNVQIGKDPWKYTRDPDKPVHYGRLRLTVNQDRPKSVP